MHVMGAAYPPRALKFFQGTVASFRRGAVEEARLPAECRYDRGAVETLGGSPMTRVIACGYDIKKNAP
jgi:hypothetical protein